jgi:hypothetical protein
MSDPGWRIGSYLEVPDYDCPDLTLLRRWKLIESPWFGVFVHHLRRSDSLNRPPHDHPWSFVSVGVRGTYTETRMTYVASVGEWCTWSDTSRARFRYRKPTDLHRVVLDDPERGAWTIVLHGPRSRVWGFRDENGWQSHNELRGPPDRRRRGLGR